MSELSFAVFALSIMLAAQSIDSDNTENILYNELEYDDTETMERANWANGGFFDCVFQKDNISFENGEMTLKLDVYEGTTYDYEYSGAEYRTKDVYGYGLYTVAMKPIKNSGVVSSFFMYTGESNGTIWDEIDIEFLGKDTTSVQFNFYADGEGDHEYIYELGYDASEEYHEYGFLWLENSISWLVDGEIVYQVTSEEYDLPTTPGQIMMNVWNGATDTKSIRDWLGEYDGTVPLEAKYDYFKFVPWGSTDTIEEDNSTTEVVDLKAWTLVDDEYRLDYMTEKTRVTRLASQVKENTYIEAALENPITDPTQIHMDLNYMNGYKLAITVKLVDEDGTTHYVTNLSYNKSQKGDLLADIEVPDNLGIIEKVQLYINSDPDYIDVAKDSYCRMFLNEMTISN